MEKNNLYKLNKDLLIKIIEDTHNLEKFSDLELLILENNIRKEKSKRNVSISSNSEDYIYSVTNETLWKYLVYLSPQNKPSNMNIEEITKEEIKKCEEYLTNLGMVKRPYVNKDYFWNIKNIRYETLTFQNFNIQKYNKKWIKTKAKVKNDDEYVDEVMMYPDPFVSHLFAYYLCNDEDKWICYDTISHFKIFE